MLNKCIDLQEIMILILDPQEIMGKRRKQEVIIADVSGKATLTLWEQQIGRLDPEKSSQISSLRIIVHRYLGEYHLYNIPSLKLEQQ